MDRVPFQVTRAGALYEGVGRLPGSILLVLAPAAGDIVALVDLRQQRGDTEPAILISNH